MTHKQKAIELLSQMPEPFNTWALENLEKYPLGIGHEPMKISAAIGMSFIWPETPQGREFWQGVFCHYMHDTPLPELPLEYRYEQLVKENEELKKKVAEFNEYKVYECTDCKQKNIKKTTVK